MVFVRKARIVSTNVERNMNSPKHLVALLMLLLSVGCAGVKTKQIPLQLPYIKTTSVSEGEIAKANDSVAKFNEKTESKFKGIRYHLPSTYLLVYASAKDKLKWEIHTLPDPTKRMSTKPYNYLATLDATFVFDEKTGVLTSSTEVADSTAVPTALITAVKEIASKRLAIANVSNEGEYPAPRLYKIIYENGRYHFVGGRTEFPEISVRKGVTIEGKSAQGDDK